MKRKIYLKLCGIGVFAIIISFCFWINWKNLAVSQTSQMPLSESIFKRGLEIYSQQCAACHGAKGQGDGLGAYLLQPKPRDFSKGTFRLVSTSAAKPTDEDLFNTITRGMLGSAMPPWGHLKEEDRWALVYAVRYWSGLPKALQQNKLNVEEIASPNWDKAKALIESESATGGSISIPSEPAVAPDQIEAGKKIYLSACASCHGPDGKGNVPQRFKDESGYPLVARDFTEGIFKGGSASPDLYRRLIVGIPGSPMPSYRDAFTDEQIWELIHYVQTLVPKGAQEENQQKPTVIRVKKIKEPVPTEPEAAAWQEALPARLPVMPLWWHSPRITHIEVQALHDGKTLSVKISWEDATRDDGNAKDNLFTDEVSVQLASEEVPPFFAMGDSQTPVNLWLWKASTQKDMTHFQDVADQYPNMPHNAQYLPFKNHGKDNEQLVKAPEDPKRITAAAVGNQISQPDRKTPVENLLAKGFGTLTMQRMMSQNVRGSGEWKAGRWEVVFTRELSPLESTVVTFSRARKTPVAFAVWDGGRKERNGQKSITLWHQLELE